MRGDLPCAATGIERKPLVVELIGEYAREHPVFTNAGDYNTHVHCRATVHRYGMVKANMLRPRRAHD